MTPTPRVPWRIRRAWPRKAQRRYFRALCRVFAAFWWEPAYEEITLHNLSLGDLVPLRVHSITWAADRDPNLWLTRRIQGTFTIKAGI